MKHVSAVKARINTVANSTPVKVVVFVALPVVVALAAVHVANKMETEETED